MHLDPVLMAVGNGLGQVERPEIVRIAPGIEPFGAKIHGVRPTANRRQKLFRAAHGRKQFLA